MLRAVDVVGVHGVVGRDELLAAGMSRDAIKHQLKRGGLIAIHRGVYAIGHAQLSDLGRIRAALLATGPRASASHETAAYLDHLIPTLPAVIHVTVNGGAQRNRPGVIVHRTSREFEKRRVAGLRVTPTLRTLEDLRWDDKLVREALARSLIRPEHLPEQVDSMPTQSKLERRMRRLCSDAGLPQPVAQWKCGRYRVDFAWPRHRVIVETDGWGTHGRRQAFENDRAKDADLIALGFVVLRFTWRQLERTPTQVAARLAAALALAPGAR
jgi:very-short-patch-repair endonuclease